MCILSSSIKVHIETDFFGVSINHFEAKENVPFLWLFIYLTIMSQSAMVSSNPGLFCKHVLSNPAAKMSITNSFI